MTSRQKALLVADFARQKNAEDIVVLDIRKVANITNFFIVATANSARQAQTIAETIEKGLVEAKASFSNIEGYKEANWILIDAYDVVAHIFNRELRMFYNLEGLWGDAKRVRLCQKKRKKYSKKTSKRK